MAKQQSFFVCLILLLFFLATGAGAAGPGTDFDLAVSGQRVSDAEVYGSSVTITLTPKAVSKTLEAYIQYQGVWMRLKSRSDGSYVVTFTKNGEYAYQFRLEDSATRDVTTKEINFSIDSQTAKLAEEISALPNLNQATDSRVMEQKSIILSIKKRYNQLSEQQRSRFPAYPAHCIQTLYQWLSHLEPAVDYREPEPPALRIVGAQSSGDYYAGPVTVQIVPQDNWDVHSILYQTNGGSWQTLTPMEDGQYSVALSGSKTYQLNVCVQSKNARVGESASTKVVIDPVLYQIVSETQRLYQNAAFYSKDVYFNALETAWLQYVAATPRQQDQIPAETAGRLKKMYAEALETSGLSNKSFDDQGNFIKGYGMLTRLRPADGEAAPVRLSADRVNRVLIGGQEMQKRVQAEYRIDFVSAGGLPVSCQIEESLPMLFQIQIPEDLMGKKNVDLLYLKDGKYVSTGAKVRSTEAGLVLCFQSSALGSFLFVCD